MTLPACTLILRDFQYFLRNILENQIVLYGESLGTAISVNVAQYKEFAGIILEAPFTSMLEMGQKYYPIFPVKYLLKDKFETIKKIKNLRSPILILSLIHI